MVRPAGLAPASSEWKSDVLLLDDDRIINEYINKHRYQFSDELVPAGKFLGGSFGVSGTPPSVMNSRALFANKASKVVVFRA